MILDLFVVGPGDLPQPGEKQPYPLLNQRELAENSKSLFNNILDTAKNWTFLLRLIISFPDKNHGQGGKSDCDRI